MKVLLDSGVWWWRFHRLPLAKGLTEFLEREVSEFWLSPVSVAEMLYKWRHKPKLLPGPDPASWLDGALTGFRVAPFSLAVARRAGLWDWQHGDPADRILAATAVELDLTLTHTDLVLKALPGFPQRYFPAVKH